MPYKDITYDNGFTERFYYDETLDEEAPPSLLPGEQFPSRSKKEKYLMPIKKGQIEVEIGVERFYLCRIQLSGVYPALFQIFYFFFVSPGTMHLISFGHIYRLL